jgi:hypothetical protein
MDSPEERALAASDSCLRQYVHSSRNLATDDWPPLRMKKSLGDRILFRIARQSTMIARWRATEEELEVAEVAEATERVWIARPAAAIFLVKYPDCQLHDSLASWQTQTSM